LFRGGAALSGLISANALKHNGQPSGEDGRQKSPGAVGAMLDRANPDGYIKSPSGPMTLQSVTGTVARWQSGDAADCKSVYVGSIPTRASKSLNSLNYRI
jgi:hypothetical protein